MSKPAQRKRNAGKMKPAKTSGLGETVEKASKDVTDESLDTKDNLYDAKVSKQSSKQTKRGGGLCCSSSSVEVKDSLQPLDPKAEVAATNDAFEENDELTSNEENYDDAYDKENMEVQQTSKKRVKKKSNAGYVEDEPKIKSVMPLAFSSRKGKYSVNRDDDPLYATIEHRPPPAAAPRKKKSSPKKIPQNDNSSIGKDVEISKGESAHGTQKKMKAKKQKKENTDVLEMRSVYESQIASLQDHPTMASEHYSGTDFSATGQPTVEVERDLLDNAEEERRKNKQRVRERKMKEKQHESPAEVSPASADAAYENAQKEIDKVLGPQQKEKDEQQQKSKSKHRTKDRKKEREEKTDDEEESSGKEKVQEGENIPENLEEARQRMHQLLDDAFSLFSQSQSSIGNKVHPSPHQSSDEKSSTRSENSQGSHKEQVEPVEPVPEEKKHTPILVERSHGPYDNSGLIAWSPYRASDETALISLPVSQTNLSVIPPQREQITTSTFSETLPTSLRPNYYTTLPGEPIVIKMQELNTLPKMAEDPASYPDSAGQPDPHSEPYFGMSSYQEIPLPSAIPSNISGGQESKHGQWIDDRKVDAGCTSPRINGVGHTDTMPHTAPSKGDNRNADIVDVVKKSMQPGASPQPLINSLRDELHSLSMRTHSNGRVANQGVANEGVANGGKELKNIHSNGSTKSHRLGNSTPGWDSLSNNKRTDL